MDLSVNCNITGGDLIFLGLATCKHFMVGDLHWHLSLGEICQYCIGQSCTKSSGIQDPYI